MNKLLAFFLLLLAPAAADAQTAVQWGNNSGTVCIYDQSVSRPCVALGTLNSSSHTFTYTGPATLGAPTSIPTTATVGTGTVAASAGALTNGHCVSINSMGQFVDAGGTCTTGGGGGTVSSGTVGQIANYTGTTAVGSFALAGDCTFSTPNITCTKTNGSAFAASATTDTTNASNIASGTVASARLPAAAVGAIGGVQSSSAGSNQFATGVNTSGVVTYAQPSFTNLSGSVAASQMPALTGDVTTSAGAVATTIAANAVTNAKAAQMAAGTIKGNNTGSTANAADLTVSQVNAILEPQWTAYAPTVTAGTGTFTSVSATGRYQQVGKRVTLNFTITITTNGTAAISVNFSLPVQSYSLGTSAGICREAAVTGMTGNVMVPPNSTVAYTYKYDNSYMGGNGYIISGSVTYESM